MDLLGEKPDLRSILLQMESPLTESDHQEETFHTGASRALLRTQRATPLRLEELTPHALA